jgi:hypothetical protein
MPGKGARKLPRARAFRIACVLRVDRPRVTKDAPNAGQSSGFSGVRGPCSGCRRVARLSSWMVQPEIPPTSGRYSFPPPCIDAGPQTLPRQIEVDCALLAELRYERVPARFTAALPATARRALTSPVQHCGIRPVCLDDDTAPESARDAHVARDVDRLVRVVASQPLYCDGRS